MDKPTSRRKKVQTTNLLELKGNTDEKRTGRPSLDDSPLTQEMKDMAKMLAEGYSNKAIEDKLGISQHCIRRWGGLQKVEDYKGKHLEVLRGRGIAGLMVSIKSLSVHILEATAELVSGRKHRAIQSLIIEGLKEAKESDLKLTESTLLDIAKLVTPKATDIVGVLKELVLIVGKLDLKGEDKMTNDKGEGDVTIGVKDEGGVFDAEAVFEDDMEEEGADN
jgi:hypothetical protein